MRCAACLLAALLSACGARTAAPADEPVEDVRVDTVIDSVADSVELPDTDPPACPAKRPLLSEGCDDEGRSCVYGTACKSECVCERGSWVCSADTCTATCPTRSPATLACLVEELDRC